MTAWPQHLWVGHFARKGCSAVINCNVACDMTFLFVIFKAIDVIAEFCIVVLQAPRACIEIRTRCTPVVLRHSTSFYRLAQADISMSCKTVWQKKVRVQLWFMHRLWCMKQCTYICCRYASQPTQTNAVAPSSKQEMLLFTMQSIIIHMCNKLILWIVSRVVVVQSSL